MKTLLKMFFYNKRKRHSAYFYCRVTHNTLNTLDSDRKMTGFTFRDVKCQQHRRVGDYEHLGNNDDDNSGDDDDIAS